MLLAGEGDPLLSLGVQVVPVLLEALSALHAVRPPPSVTRTQLLAMLERGLTKLTKTLTRIQEVNPWYVPRQTAANKRNCC